MGTRSLTRVFNPQAGEIICLYRQYDGYPECHGQQLQQFLAPLEVVNGIPVGESQPIANGAGCLAAQLVAHFKEEAGGFYLHPPGTMYVGEEYEYHVHVANPREPIQLKVFGFGEVLYSGPVREYDPHAPKSTVLGWSAPYILDFTDGWASFVKGQWYWADVPNNATCDVAAPDGIEVANLFVVVPERHHESLRATLAGLSATEAPLELLALEDVEGRTHEELVQHLEECWEAPLRDLEGVELVVAFESYEDYSGDAFYLFRKGGKLYEVHGSHCSCYGFEGQWDPEETDKAALLARPLDPQIREHVEGL